MQDVQDIQNLVTVDVQDFEAEVELLWLAVLFEGQQEFNKLHHLNLGPVEALSHPQIQNLPEIGFVHSNQVFYILSEVQLGERCNAINVGTFDLIFWCMSP